MAASSKRYPVARRTRAPVGLTVALGCVFIGLSAPATAQEYVRKTPDATTGDSLVDRQVKILERVRRLETRMLKLTKLLAESEPDKAERLRDALARASEKRVKHRVGKLVEILRERKYADADREQESLVSDMQEILELLTSAMHDVDRRRAEREQLERRKRAVRALMDQQIRILQQTRAAQAAMRLAEELRAQAAALEHLATRQAELREQSREGRTESEHAAGEQEELERETRAAAQSLDDLEKPKADRRSADAARAACQAARDAADAMGEAARGLRGSESEKAEQAQKRAEEELRRAVKRLREQAERLADEDRLRKIERLQRDAERDAAELEREMTPGKNKPQTPHAQKAVGGARGHMQKAADDLGEQQPEEAQPQQEQALEQLQEALNELEDVLRQVRREELEETLTALEARFRSMLTREERVRETVATLAARDAEKWGRVEEMRLAEAVETQQQLVQDCEATLRILLDEGTTVILPQIVRQLAADMRHAAELAASSDRLADASVSEQTRRVLDEIIEVLREIVDAIEQKRDQIQESQQGNPQQPPQGQSGEALLPGSAELKLLRSAQLRLNRATSDLAESATAKDDPRRAARLRQLADRQRRLSDLARRMHEKE